MLAQAESGNKPGIDTSPVTIKLETYSRFIDMGKLIGEEFEEKDAPSLYGNFTRRIFDGYDLTISGCMRNTNGVSYITTGTKMRIESINESNNPKPSFRAEFDKNSRVLEYPDGKTDIIYDAFDYCGRLIFEHVTFDGNKSFSHTHSEVVLKGKGKLTPLEKAAQDMADEREERLTRRYALEEYFKSNG
jgi:hypothetical protein